MTRFSSSLLRRLARWLPGRGGWPLLLALAALWAQPALATNYVFPGTLPVGCVGTPSGTYNCGSITLAYGDTITINSPKPATINVSGSFTTDTNQINAAGSAADLTLNITGTLTLGYNPTLKANITAASLTDNGGQATITGTLTTSGNISLGYKTSISGNITVTGTGSITLAQDATYGGNVTSTSGAITMGQTAQIAGSISTTTGAITVAQSAHVFGGISSTSGAVNMNFGSRLDGGITTSGAITVQQSAVVTGNLAGGTGLVDLQYGSQVTGTITTSSGNVQVAQSAKALACVKTTAPGTITLGYQAQVNSVCCGTSCSSSCVVNNSNGAMPPLCTPSTPAVDHYELSLPSASVSCLPPTVTVTACADSSSPCTNAYTGASGKTATLTTNAGTLGATNTTTTNVSFNASGVASTTLAYPGAANGASATVTLSGEQVSATNPRKCCPNGSSCSAANSCNTTFSTAGFVVASSANGATANIANQIAGTTSGTYYLRALQTNTSNGACQTALTGSQSVSVAYECNNPGSCSGSNLMSLGGGTPARNNNGTVSAGTGTYAAVNLTFDANGNAPFTLNFADVGQATLWFSKTVNSVTLTGSSNAFITRPDHLDITGIKRTALPLLNNPTPAPATPVDHTYPVFVKSGEAFTATITAYTSGGAATPNFGNETTQPAVVLTSTLVVPVGGEPGTLANATIGGPVTRATYSNGATTVTNLSWSEVGIVKLAPGLPSSSYLGVTGVTGTTTANVGRFYPDHFAIGAPQSTSICAASNKTPFTYFGQDGITTSFTVTAQNAGGGTTLNYAGNYAKLNLTSYSAYGFTGSLSPSGALPAGAAISSGALAPSGTWPAYDAVAKNSGVASVSARHIISRPTALTTETLAQVNAAPTDGEVPATTAAAAGSGTKLRFGRLVLQNAFGSDQLDLSMPLVAQYYATVGSFTGFVTNTDDSCTTLAPANVNLVNYQGGVTGANMPVSNVKSVGYLQTPASNPLNAGLGYLVLKKPTSTPTSIGNVDVLLYLGDATTAPTTAATVTCPTATPANPLGSATLAGGAPVGMAFLATNTCTVTNTQSSTYSRNPMARATFGVYKSPVIFLRENY